MANEPTSTTPKVSPFRAGIATMLVGAALLGVGMLQTTTATYQTSCPRGTEQVAKFEYERGRYEYEGSNANRNVVKITNGDEDGGNWTSTRAISAIVVKGGPGSKIMTLSPPQNSVQPSGPAWFLEKRTCRSKKGRRWPSVRVPSPMCGTTRMAPMYSPLNARMPA